MLQHPAMAVATTRTGEASNDEAEHEERGEGAFHTGAGAALPGSLKPASSIQHLSYILNWKDEAQAWTQFTLRLLLLSSCDFLTKLWFKGFLK